MTKGTGVFSFGIGCRDPRSQTRDLGHPSVATFGFVFAGRWFVIPPPSGRSLHLGVAEIGVGDGLCECGQGGTQVLEEAIQAEAVAAGSGLAEGLNIGVEETGGGGLHLPL